MAAAYVRVLFLCGIAINEITGRTLPSYLKPCKRDDSKVNECLRTMVNTLRPYVTKGMPELHILPLDPLTVPSVALNQGSSSVKFKAFFTDLKGFGAKNYDVQKVNLNLKNQSLDLDLVLPLFRIESKYDVNGQILVLPIKGNGKFVGNFTNIQAKVKFTLQMAEKKNSKTFIEIKDTKTSLKMDGLKLHFYNLFDGNKELGDQTNQFVNKNWRILMQETKPLIEETVSTIVVGIFKPMFQAYSLEDLFPV